MHFKKLLLLIVALLFSYIIYKHLKSKAESPFTRYAKLIPGTYRVGFTNLDKEVVLKNLETEGKVPMWLSGTLYRNGPAKFSSDGSWISNWFDGLAMIHAVKFENGQVSYVNKFLRTDDYKSIERTGKLAHQGFIQAGTDQNFFSELWTWIIPEKLENKQIVKELHNANVHIDVIDDNFVALTEVPLPVHFDSNNLNTLGTLNYSDNLPKDDIHDTAHLHYDYDRKEHIGYFTTFGRKSYHNIFKIKDGSTTREVIASYEVERPSYMHSFAITKNYAILTLLPLVVNPLDLLLSTKGFIENFKYKPELGTNLLVVDRIKNRVIGAFQTEPFFAFHTVNAYEADDKINLDIVIYPDARGLEVATFDKILAPQGGKERKLTVEPDAQNTETGKLTRFTIDLNTGQVSSKALTEKLIELPRINYKKHNGNDYKFVYAFSESENAPNAYVADQLVKIDIKTGEILKWQEDKCYPGEPVFVESPNAKSEDDGLVMSLVLDAKTEKSFLLILNAEDFTEIARAKLPHHVPFGIHGRFIG